MIVPETLPGVFSGFLLAISLSLDDFVITRFTTGSGLLSGDAAIMTLSTYVQGKIKKSNIPAELRALTTIIFVVVVLFVIGISVYRVYKEKYGKYPDIVISGFHLMVKCEYRDNELQEVRSIADELKKYQIKFYTCHCTGIPAFEEMKKIMGSQLEYIHSGEEIVL